VTATAAAAIPLGAFALHAPAGRGGMGEVWRGVHRAEGTPVAVKVVSTRLAGERAWRALFRREVRAVAELDHPNIVLLWDQGEVGAEAEEASGGRLAAGSPYLVMEWASGGTLAQSAPPRRWEELQEILLVLLDALAHAHARGIEHRDLKPGNVLVCSADDLRPGLKLADFGAAHRGAAAGGEAGVAVGTGATTGADAPTVQGTRAYMSPEQASLRWRDEGPWTDLFALGALAWKLATGAKPWPAEPGAIVSAWVPVPFAPVLEGPPRGLEPWLRRLLEPDPARRYRRAADAAAALRALDAHPGRWVAAGGAADARRGAAVVAASPTPAPPATAAGPEGDTLTSQGITQDVTGWEAAQVRQAAYWPPPAVEGALPPEVPAPASAVAEAAATGAPPAASARPRPRLPGAGLGLHGLRPLPLVDRDSERSALDGALAAVAAQGRARLVVLAGASGAGKSRLARWLCERAHERGTATVLRAGHGPIPGPADGLGAMILRHARCAGLERPWLVARLRALATLLDAGGAGGADEEALVEIVAPGASSLRFVSALERHAAVGRLLARLARERPLVVWLDDVQWGMDALGFAAYFLEAQSAGPAPVLLLATARDDALVERPAERAALAALLARPDAERLEVGALAAEHRGALVRELLGLSAALAARVEERSAGSPLFAVQLVADWTRRGLLVPGGDGLQLRAGAAPELPDSLGGLWAGALEHLLAQRGPADGPALEVAAALGQDVDATEWAAVCTRLGIAPDEALVEAIVSRGLAREAREVRAGAPGGWSFVHGMLREALAARARAAGRAAEQHRACAALLRGQDGPDAAERLGRHLVAAGDLAQAIAPLMVAAEARLSGGEPRRAAALLSQVEAAGLGPEDPRQPALDALRAEAARLEGDYDSADALAARAAGAPGADGATRARALAVLGGVARERGNVALAQRTWRAAIDEAERAGEHARAAMLLRWLGIAHADRGEPDLAAGCHQRALAAALAAGDELSAARTELALGGLLLNVLERPADAQAAIESALERMRRSGARGGEADVLNALGELARWRGHHDRALEHYQAAATVYDSVGSRGAVVARLNVGQTLVEAGRAGEAEAVIQPCLALLARSGRRGLQVIAHVALLACAAARADWAAWDAHAAAAEELLRATGFADTDVARAAATAAETARAAGDAPRAARAFALSAAQWRALGRAAQADAMERAATARPAPSGGAPD